MHASSENSSGNFDNLAAIFNILQALLFTICVLLVENSLYWLVKVEIATVGQNDLSIVF